MLIISSHHRLDVFKMVFRHICVNSCVCNHFCVNTDQMAKSVVNDTGVSEDVHKTGWLK